MKGNFLNGKINGNRENVLIKKEKTLRAEEKKRKFNHSKGVSVYNFFKSIFHIILIMLELNSLQFSFENHIGNFERKIYNK